MYFICVYFWLRWVFVAACRLSLVAVSRGYSSLQCTGFSLQWLLLLQSMGSRCVGFSSCGSRSLERRLSSCGARAQLLRSMWDLPGPGLEPVSPALAGGFLITVPPGKPTEAFQFDVPLIYFCCLYFWCHIQKIIAKINVKEIFPLFSFRCVIVSYLIFKSFIDFELIFVSGVRQGSNFILHRVIQFPLHLLLKRLSVPH